MNSPDPQGWTITVNQVADGVYRAEGKNASGQTVEATGTDEDLVREQCKLQAARHDRLIGE